MAQKVDITFDIAVSMRGIDDMHEHVSDQIRTMVYMLLGYGRANELVSGSSQYQACFNVLLSEDGMIQDIDLTQAHEIPKVGGERVSSDRWFTVQCRRIPADVLKSLTDPKSIIKNGRRKFPKGVDPIDAIRCLAESCIVRDADAIREIVGMWRQKGAALNASAGKKNNIAA
ncbi:hypothetical protein [Azospirillum brasilense]|uniref:hypothetical protein n=1 Tax=Azospirillum brasilense TaxID=192 RepID=UPI000E68594F|nr:hypothetical protein [Azospirillum brasilense]NUB24689.1 hypothetical protein [Azospirillum brasilense]NUB30398.1 hypothetical protein [Azospirillum brasilense]RIW08315.1 hypothetical protein D2T81_00970 [Azospirillum brasilense]